MTNKKTNIRKSGYLIIILLLVSTLTSCCVFTSSHYDYTTIRNLAGIRGRIIMLYQTLQSNIDEMHVADVRNGINEILTYEKNKKCNDQVIKITVQLAAMFEQHVSERRAGNWSVIIKDNYVMQINTLLDQAVNTEDAKPK